LKNYGKKRKILMIGMRGKKADNHFMQPKTWRLMPMFCRRKKMNWKKTEAEFDNFTKIYARFIVGDKALPIMNPGCEAAISRLQPRSILDCACGQGRSSIALKKAGYIVHGSDISIEMIKLARMNARKAGLHVPFTVTGWHDLPSKISKKFDFVMCHGNAIGHCRGERSMIQSLKAIRKVTKDTGYLYLDTRSWEWFRTKSGRFWPNKCLVDKDGRHTII
jgi:2-polyprenyl-3-methyl-5-hydroxy-6-metoxy-1,4-benzoquinol methylase